MNRSQFLMGFLMMTRLLATHGEASVTANILAGGETALPADTPSGRLQLSAPLPLGMGFPTLGKGAGFDDTGGGLLAFSSIALVLRHRR